MSVALVALGLVRFQLTSLYSLCRYSSFMMFSEKPILSRIALAWHFGQRTEPSIFVALCGHINDFMKQCCFTFNFIK